MFIGLDEIKVSKLKEILLKAEELINTGEYYDCINIFTDTRTDEILFQMIKMNGEGLIDIYKSFDK